MEAPEAASFQDHFVALFQLHFPRLYRYFDRLSGDPDMAADIVQEAFVRLYRRGSLPDAPEAWLIGVALTLFRSVKSGGSRRLRFLTRARGQAVLSDESPAPGHAAVGQDSRRRVRTAIDRLPERERRLLLLRAEGYSYRDLAAALDLNEASIGTLLARARAAFTELYGDADAP